MVPALSDSKSMRLERSRSTACEVEDFSSSTSTFFSESVEELSGLWVHVKRLSWHLLEFEPHYTLNPGHEFAPGCLAAGAMHITHGMLAGGCAIATRV